MIPINSILIQVQFEVTGLHVLETVTNYMGFSTGEKTWDIYDEKRARGRSSSLPTHVHQSHTRVSCAGQRLGLDVKANKSLHENLSPIISIRWGMLLLYC